MSFQAHGTRHGPSNFPAKPAETERVPQASSPRWEELSLPFAVFILDIMVGKSGKRVTMKSMLKARPGGVGPTRGRNAVAHLETVGKALYSPRKGWRLTEYGREWVEGIQADARRREELRIALAKAHEEEDVEFGFGFSSPTSETRVRRYPTRSRSYATTVFA